MAASQALPRILTKRGHMRKHNRHQETEAVRGGTDLHKKNGPLATPDLPDFHFRSHRQRSAGARHLDRHVLHPLRQPDSYRSRKGDCGAGRRRCRAALRFRHERHHHFDPVPAEEWRPRGGPARHLRRRYQVLQPVAAQVRHRDHVRGHGRVRSACARDPAQYEAALPGIADQSHPARRRFAPR